MDRRWDEESIGVGEEKRTWVREEGMIGRRGGGNDREERRE